MKTAYFICSLILIAISFCLYLRKGKTAKEYSALLGKKVLIIPDLAFFIPVTGMILFTCCIFFPEEDELTERIAYVFFFIFQLSYFCCAVYFCRWTLIYDSQGFVFRTAFGKFRECSYSDIVKVEPFFSDLHVYTDKGSFYIDKLVGWGDFKKNYYIWELENGTAAVDNRDSL